MSNLNDLLLQTKELLDGAGFPWAVCGGFALELFLDREIRWHTDIDICVFEPDRERVWRHMHQNWWSVYEFLGQGLLRSIYPARPSKPGRNLMCVKLDCDLVRFCPGIDDETYGYEFYNNGIFELNYMEFLFNTTRDGWFVFPGQSGIRREMSKAFLSREGVPYLAPELALLFKANRAEWGRAQTDFEAVFPHLGGEQRQWFLESLGKLYPDGHEWGEGPAR